MAKGCLKIDLEEGDYVFYTNINRSVAKIVEVNQSLNSLVLRLLKTNEQVISGQSSIEPIFPDGELLKKIGFREEEANDDISSLFKILYPSKKRFVYTLDTITVLPLEYGGVDLSMYGNDLKCNANDLFVYLQSNGVNTDNKEQILLDLYG